MYFLRRLSSFVARSGDRPLWILEAAALSLSYLVYYFIGVQLEIIKMPRLLFFVFH